MFNIGEYVVYGNKGVCEVKNIGPVDIPGMPAERQYYTLSQVFTRSSTIFVPVDKVDSGMRYVISKDKAFELIDTIPDIKPIWIQNDKERDRLFTENIRKADTKTLIEMMITLTQRRERRIADGKKPASTDERFYHSAEEILYGEMSIALGIDKSEVKDILWKNSQ